MMLAKNQYPLAEPEATNDNVENIENDIYDELLLTEPLLNIGGEMTHAKIIGRKRDD
jgi:t-SNARE complex subunit (syntaxin)